MPNSGGYIITRGRLLSVIFIALAALGTAAAQNAITDWNNIAITTALAASQVTAPGSNSPGGSIIYLTYVHLAIYDAVNAIDHRFESYGPDIPAPAGASKEAAAIEADSASHLGRRDCPVRHARPPSLTSL